MADLHGLWEKPQPRINAARKRTRHLFARHEKAVVGGNSLKVSVARWSLLNEKSPKIYYAYKAAGRLGVDPMERPYAALWAANALRWDSPPMRPEDVLVRLKKNGFRVLFDFGLVRLAGLSLLSRIVLAGNPLADWQFDHRGVYRAILAVQKAIESGYVYYAHVDIKNHYPSFGLKGLQATKVLPEDLVEKWVVAEMIPVGRSYGYAAKHIPLEDVHTQAHQGLPQGSPLAAAVAQFVGSKLKWSAPPGVILINYADNYLVLSISLKGLDEAVKDLRARICKLPGGPFSTTLEGPAHVGEAFAFLGHLIALQPEGSLLIEPTDTNLFSLYEMLNEFSSRYEYVFKGKKALTFKEVRWVGRSMADALRYARSWAQAFKASPTAWKELEAIEACIEQERIMLGIDKSYLVPTEHPFTQYHWHGYK